MKTIKMINTFPSFCSDGQKASSFLINDVLPVIDNENITFDFEKIRNMNSSFSNALFSNLIKKKGINVLEKINFLNCEDNIKILISTSIEMGINELHLKKGDN